MFDLRHPFFNPLWRRAPTLRAGPGLALFERVTGSPGWPLMFGAPGVWAGSVLPLTRRPVENERTDHG